MEKNNTTKDLLKKVLQQNMLEKPDRNFTTQVMREIYSDIRNEVVINPELAKVLNQVRVDQPSNDFTQSVMNKLSLSPAQRIGNPIISKSGWLYISGITACVCLLFAVQNPTSSAESVTHSFLQISRMVETIVRIVSAIDYLYFNIFICVWVLLSIDYAMRFRLSSRKRSHIDSNLQ
jgi:hypothetical protein